MEPRPTHVDSDEDEVHHLVAYADSSNPRSSSYRREEAPEGLAEGQVTESEPVPTPASVETASSTSLQGQEESTDLKNMQSGSPIEMMPSIGM